MNLTQTQLKSSRNSWHTLFNVKPTKRTTSTPYAHTISPDIKVITIYFKSNLNYKHYYYQAIVYIALVLPVDEYFTTLIQRVKQCGDIYVVAEPLKVTYLRMLIRIPRIDIIDHTNTALFLSDLVYKSSAPSLSFYVYTRRQAR